MSDINYQTPAPRVRRLQRLMAVVLTFVLLLGAAPASAARDELAGADLAKLEPALQTAIRANPDRKLRVIVQRQVGKDKADKRAREADVENDLKAEGGKVLGRLGLIDGHTVSLPARKIVKLSQSRKIKALSLDHDVQLEQIVTVPSLISTWTQEANAPQTWSTQGVNGTGVTVAVIDSGVSANADFSNAVFGVDVATGTTTLGDLGGHGTHVAGIIAGNGTNSNGAYKGVAPGARILDVKVTTNDGHATYSNIIAGLQWIVANKRTYNIRVANLSLGATPVASFVEDPLDAAVEIAWFRGIAVIASAGNNGPTAGTIVVPGNDPYIITVGAVDDNLTPLTIDDVVPDWTSRGPTPYDNLPKPDVAASGRRVVSLRSVGSFLDQTMPDRVEGNGKYFRLSGTSMAAPVVAGVVALMVQANPSLTPNQIKYILKQTARPVLLASSAAVGSGAVDALAAVKLAKQGVGDAKANKNQTPNKKTAAAVWSVVKKMTPVWRNKGWWHNRYWVDGGWDLSGFRTTDGGWDDGGWDQTAWDNFNWEDGGWDDGGWDDGGWDSFTWNDGGWDSSGWDSSDWNSVDDTGTPVVALP
jgi:serine protease AprX